ncbi:unnamed protein product [Bemisia tabaci]|uniref:Small ribosomal subunit protein bS6m n=1 Tax=Bemisia tabaci TaxID=7038 RepID=A0A9P0F0W5_BEMTA|nr:unnamed protein product [Bemisia tabaci]
MPSYELALLLRVMPREEIVSSLKRVSSQIFNTGGFIRKIQNIGQQPTPYKMSAEYGPHREANYFVVEFEVAPHHLLPLKRIYERDVDIIRSNIFKVKDPAEESHSCTLDDELKPPAYRKEVQDMIAASLKVKNWKPKSAWLPNTGLHYYPFQR